MTLKATLSFTGLTKGLDERTYSIAKVHAWMDLLNQSMRPVKFNNPTKNGTRVNVEQIANQEGYDRGVEELEGYIYVVNKKYGTDICLKPDQKDH